MMVGLYVGAASSSTVERDSSPAVSSSSPSSSSSTSSDSAGASSRPTATMPVVVKACDWPPDLVIEIRPEKWSYSSVVAGWPNRDQATIADPSTTHHAPVTSQST